MQTIGEILLKNERKQQDISLLKRVSNILISVWEIPQVLMSISQGQCLVINRDGRLFTGKVNTEKLHSLGQRIAGKTEGDFDINAYVSSDITMLENQEIHSKQLSNIRGKDLQNATRLFKDDSSIYLEIFMRAWEFQEENHPENVTIDHEISPMGHGYLLVKIKGLSFYGKIAEKTGKLMYIVTLNDGKEIPI